MQFLSAGINQPLINHFFQPVISSPLLFVQGVSPWQLLHLCAPSPPPSFSTPLTLSLCLSLPPSRCLAAREERKSPSAPFSLWEEHQWISRPNCVGQREVGSWVRRTSPRISLPTPIKAPVVSPPPSPSQWPVACVGAGTNQNTQAAQVLFGLSCLSVVLTIKNKRAPGIRAACFSWTFL